MDISVEADDRSEAFALAGNQLRAAVHSACRFTPDLGSAAPIGNMVATALNSAQELIET